MSSFFHKSGADPGERADFAAKITQAQEAAEASAQSAEEALNSAGLASSYLGAIQAEAATSEALINSTKDAAVSEVTTAAEAAVETVAELTSEAQSAASAAEAADSSAQAAQSAAATARDAALAAKSSAETFKNSAEFSASSASAFASTATTNAGVTITKASEATASAAAAAASASAAQDAQEATELAAASVDAEAIQADISDLGSRVTALEAGGGLAEIRTIIRELAIDAARDKGGRLGFASGVADDFQDQTGVNAGASTAATYDAATKSYVIGTQLETSESLPAMTANNAPSGHVTSASSEFDAAFAAWKAADDVTLNPGSNTNSWLCLSATGWWQRQAPSPIRCGEYKISTTNTTNWKAPSDFTLQASNNGSSWVTLDTRTGVTWNSGGETKSFTIAEGNRDNYSYHRIDVTASTGDGSRLCLQEVQLLQALVADGDLRSVAYTAAAAPTKAGVMILAEALAGGPIAANTNLLAALSRDGGTTFSPFTLLKTGSYGGVEKYEADGLDLTGQPSGTSVVLRVQTDAGLTAKIHADYWQVDKMITGGL